MIGETIHGKYRVLEQISEDWLATTYLARDQGRNELVIVKLLRAEHGAGGQFLERFRAEADKLQHLTSPQVLKALDCGELNEAPYVVFQYAGGKTLADLCQAEGELSLERALEVASQLGLCLVEAHAHSLVHSDLRPVHILLTSDGLVKVANFGLAQSLDLGRLIAEGKLEQDAYHAPELTANAVVDSRGDLYSLGAILFEMLAGQPPALSDADQRPGHLQPDLPPELDDLVARCLAGEPNKRPQSAAEFLEGIDEVLRGLSTAPGGGTFGIEEALAGHTLGPYRMVEKLGHGGMATVYKAYEASLDRYVAVKVLPQHFAHDPTFLTRFRREAKAIARLNHPNIVPVFNFGEEGDLTYIAMQYVEGGTLKKLLGQPMPPEGAIKLAVQIARALSYAHKRDVIHRDIKPANVLIAEGDWPLLSDFGLARMLGSSVQLTQTGVGVGTPAYMSPEQGQGLQVDGRSDIYSLGIMLYEMLTGRVPFQADTPLAVVLKHLTAPLPMPREINPYIPESVERIILKATAKEAAHRYQTADEMIVAMEQALAELPVEAPAGPAQVPATLPAPTSASTGLTGMAGPDVSAATEVLAPPRPRSRVPIWALGLVGGLALAGLLVVVVLLGLLRRAADRKEIETEVHTSPTATVQVQTGVIEPDVTPAPAVTQPKPPISSDQPSLAGLEVKPCAWDNLGAGLCIQPLDGGRPIHILADSDMEFSAPPSWSPDGQRIVFSALKRGGDPSRDNRIYIVNADGSHLTELPAIGNDIGPAWSPDGEWLAFHSSCNLGVMRPDGSDQSLLWHSDGKPCVGQPQWSPDSQLLVASMPEGGEWHLPMTREVWVFSRDGSKPTSVASITHQSEACVREEVAFSPGGRQVAYVDDACQAWLVNADGSGQAARLDEFSYDWTAGIHPQWGAAGTAAKAVFEDNFEEKTLDLARWQPWGDTDETSAGLRDGQFRLDIENKRLRPWEGGLKARLAAPVKRIKFHIGLDQAQGPNVGFGVSFVDASDETRRVLLNAAGDVLFQHALKIKTLSPAKSPPLHYELLLEWEGEEVQVYVDGKPVGAIPGPGLGRDVAFWVHLGPGGRVTGYLDDVVMEYGKKEELPPPSTPTPPPVAEGVGKIAEQCEDASPAQICVRDTQTGQISQITGDLEFEELGGVAWSPDGKLLVFDAGSAFATTGQHDHKLYLINADGSDMRQITSGDTNDLSADWSPDGEWIAFHRNCDLWLVRPDGSDARRVLERSDTFCTGMIAWSPDSQQIAFANMHTAPAVPRTVDTVRRDGSDLRVVYTFEDPQAWVHQVAWSPDGGRLAIWYQQDEAEHGLLIQADGSGQPETIKEMPLSWLPDFWPRWGEAPEAASPPADPWGQIVVPPGEPVRLAFVGGLSGEAPGLGEVEKNGFLMAIGDQPAVHGFQLEAPLIVDSGCTDEELSRQAARQVVSDSKVAGVIGHTCSVSCQIGVEMYEKAHLVMISPSCTKPGLSEPGYQVFNRVAIRDDQGGDERNRQVVETDPYQDFARRYQERHGQPLDSAGLDIYAAYAYDATAVLIQAIERVALVDDAGNLVIGRQALARAVRTTPGHPGVTGSIRFDDRGDRLPW